MGKRNLLDKVVSYIDPVAGIKRARARLAEDSFRKYEAGSKGHRTGGWISGSTDSNSEILPYIVTIRNRARDLVRNNPFAEKGVRSIAVDVVGAGIIPQVKTINDKKKQNAKKVDLLLKNWADTTLIDQEGMSNLYSMQTIVMRESVEAGQCLAVRRWVKTSRKNQIPFKIQILEIDHLAIDYSDRLKDGNVVKNGMEFDSSGALVAYYLYNNHPGDNHTFATLEKTRWPAEDVATTFRIDRAGQKVGVPWLAPVMIRLKDFDEYEDAQLVKQKISAMFAGFIREIEGDSDTKGDFFEGGTIRSGLIKRLPPGTDMVFATPPAVTGYSEYSKVSLQAIAAGLGVTYEVLTTDLGNVNFSSGRMGWLQYQRNITQWTDHLMVSQFCKRIEAWFFEACSLIGHDVSDLYMTWTPPRREMIDPVKETNAIIAQIRAGLKSHSKAVSELGTDPEDHYLEIQSDNKKFDELELILDTDPRKVGKQGNVIKDETE